MLLRTIVTFSSAFSAFSAFAFGYGGTSAFGSYGETSAAFGCSETLAAQTPPAQASQETLRQRIEQIHDAPRTLVAGERLLEPDAVAHFFEARAFAPAWTAPGASGQILDAIRAIDRDGLTPSDYHLAKLEAIAKGPSTDADAQILFTDAVAALVDHVKYGKVRPITLDRRWNVDPRAGAAPLESLVAEVAAAPSASAALEALKPNHFIYAGLKQALARYRTYAVRGGWPAIPAAGPSIKPGASDKRIPLVRQRLVATGDLDSVAPGAGESYDETLQKAVQKFQERHRLAADGVIGRTTVDAMNVTAAERADQVRVNLERARWVLGGMGDSFVLVNLPAFKVYVIRNHKNVWESRTVIGQNARQTPAFRADMRYIVFNPDWTVPPTILAKDVLDDMRQGKNAIARKRLTIYDRQGNTVDPSTIDWATATPHTFPYTLRQAPGDDNALGRVKFIFPNEHSIFLHDTPHRDLFSQDKRTFSSGCIRVENPLDLAATLLQGQDDWSPEKIKTVVDSGKSQTVFLKTPLPVVIVYWTVSVGATGDLHVARDVYLRDPPLLRALNAPPATAPSR
jgi:L,D-transpeptidase YcbB